MPGNESSADDFDWVLTSFEGARREQLRRWSELPLERIILAIEEMRDVSEQPGRTRAQEYGENSPTSPGIQEASTTVTYSATSMNLSIANKEHFASKFSSLTGHAPFRWQWRLFREWFALGRVPSYCDIPTGLGKTSVMAAWLVARALGAALPRRLVYVVDRRAVVDQATQFAGQLHERAGSALGIENLPISTLRGQFVDNRHWLEDPASLAIIVGTIDMIGSRLLFEGYGVSRGMRPYQAGMLGADTLVVLDEAHLCSPFEALLNAIATDDRLMSADDAYRVIVPKFRLLSLSATGRSGGQNPFRLEDADADPKYQHEVHERLTARKRLALNDLPEGRKLENALADRAWKLGDGDKRVIVFCDSRKTAQNVERALRGSKREKRELEIELLVGARRVRERQLLATWLQENQFTAPLPEAVSLPPRNRPAFLVATSAGEVGVDLDADHMVCDLVAYERMVQRLGRVNRRGGSGRVAQVDVLCELPNPPKASATKAEKEKYAASIKRFEARKAPLDALPVGEDGRRDASPSALIALKEGVPDLIAEATTREPLRPRLDRAVVDSWSLTSLREHPGRPEPGPWLRGWVDDDEPQTAVIWRRWLPWRIEDDKPAREEVEEFFNAARPHASEVLETETRHVIETLLSRAVDFSTQKDSIKTDTAVSLRIRTGVLLLTRSREFKREISVAELAGIPNRRNHALNRPLFEELANSTVVVSAALGGLDENGLLDSKSRTPPACLDDDDDDWIEGGMTTVGYRVLGPGAVVTGDWREASRFSLSNADEEDTVQLTLVVLRAKDAQQLGDLAVSRRAQSLVEHGEWAAQEAEALGIALKLDPNYIAMLKAAAGAHDVGKKRDLWQDAMRAPSNGRPYAKTTGRGDPHRLKIGRHTYRHEFGSLRDAETDPAIQVLPDALRDLALHLIAAHHGHARPTIAPVDPDVPTSQHEVRARAREATLRFARLQRQWGPWGLAWWEAVLRAADQRASRRLSEGDT